MVGFVGFRNEIDHFTFIREEIIRFELLIAGEQKLLTCGSWQMLRFLWQRRLKAIRFESPLETVNSLIFELDCFKEPFVSVGDFIFFEMLSKLLVSVKLPVQNQADIQP